MLNLIAHARKEINEGDVDITHCETELKQTFYSKTFRPTSDLALKVEYCSEHTLNTHYYLSSFLSYITRFVLLF